jgi:endonuclease/exonuclease/phosphatase family metal-dependent hydrolase
MQIRAVTYNVHRCRGMDRRVRPQRIVEVLRRIGPDVVALQEVLHLRGGPPEKNQVRYIADALGFYYRFGPNRGYRGAEYGNAVLSRFPVQMVGNYDLSVAGREPRGALHVDLALNGRVLHVLNVHLGTAYLERRRQARRLAEHELLLGERDFNEWAPGLTTRLLRGRLQSVDVRTHLRRRRTYPGLFPVMHLDHIYFHGLEHEYLELVRTPLTLVASDHLPLVADFRLRLRG